MEEKRVITKEKAEAFAEMHGIPFLEVVSAKTDLNVNQAFEQLSKIMVETIERKLLLLNEKKQEEMSKCCIIWLKLLENKIECMYHAFSII